MLKDTVLFILDFIVMLTVVAVSVALVFGMICTVYAIAYFAVMMLEFLSI